MAYTTLWSYTWDLTYDTVGDTIGMLKNEIGLDAVSVATSYHTYEMLCAHRKGRKFLHAPESAVYFHPRMTMYEETPIKPHVSPLVRERDQLRDIGDACVAHGLSLVSWTVCLHNSYLATNYPDHAQVNAFGDVYSHALCASSPAVRTYMTALVRDLTTGYPVAAVELEGLNFQGYRQGHYHAKIGPEPGPVESCLFSLCFCPHCLVRAHERNIDAEQLRASVCDTLNRFCEHPTPIEQTPAEYVDADEALGAYVRLRADTVASLAREVKQAVSTPVYYLLMGDYYTGGMCYHDIVDIVDRVEILTYSASPEQVSDSIRDIYTYRIRPDQLTVGMQAYAPASPDRKTLLSTTQAALDQDVRGFSFYNYGIMPRKNLDWVKAAVETIRAAGE